MKILHFSSDGSSEMNSARWRISNMSDALIRAGHQVKVMAVRHWIYQTEQGRFYCNWADIIIVHRVMVQESIDAVEFWRSRGKPVVIDFDDAYDKLEGDYNPAAEFWKDGLVTIKSGGTSYRKRLPVHPLELFRQGISKCTAATVPSRQLVKDWGHLTPFFYLENYIDSRRYLNVPQRPGDDKIVIGWGGSLGHKESFEYSGVGEALRRVISENRRVYFMLVGDQRLKNYLPVPAHAFIFKNYVHYTTWPQILSMYDIGIAPLAGEFDLRRSPIKLTEYATMGIPFVATGDSDCLVYKDYFGSPAGKFTQFGGRLTTRVKSWYNALSEMVQNIDEYRTLADEKRNYGLQFDADKNVDKVIEIYRQIIQLQEIQ